MRRIATTLLILAALGQSAAMAQQKTPVDVAAMPEAVKTLKWQSIDLSSLSPRERCQSLMLLSNALSEIGAQSTSNADLMSEYIDTKDLGGEFMSQPPIDTSKTLSLEDAHKVAVALLRGPMAQSSYATELADVPDSQLPAYQQLYQSGAQAKWSGFVHNRLQMLSMSNFLQTSGKLADYNAWVPGEVKRRSDEFEAELAQRNAAAAAEREARKEKAQEQKQAKEQQAQQEQESRQMEQAIASAGQSQSSSGQSTNDDDDDYYYGGGAYLARAAWTRDAARVGAAAARTDNRMANWSRGGGGGRRGGGGGRR
jgi:hypothetical protein